MSTLIRFEIVTPEGKKASVECESVNVFARDNAQGEGGGSVGFRPGHMPAVAALGKGEVCAFSGGKRIYSAFVEGGFALVRDNTVTVLTESITGGGE
ncbi:MAG: hypothetical protein J5925_07155 [Clostridia bacterium]|nr:hypothetical protein [Clostridia bacterium]